MGKYICKDCEKTIRFFEFPLCPACGYAISPVGTHPHCQRSTSLNGLFALAHHDGAIKTLIHKAKYQDRFAMLQEGTTILAQHLPTELKTADVIIPVPLHPKRQRERGFNQSEILAKALGKELDIPTASKVLKRTRYTHAQMNLKREERLKNLDGAFELVNPDILRALAQQRGHQLRILLIDDVTTTRSTLNECAKAIKKHVRCKIYGIVLAHGK
ncbi:hypothetical protein C5B42_01955 [Candidatus Cerribacteria bacterium 'Amazon FNV 2010 28 9']|uniref:Phosphoribosyltransferase domain-containing protein n=1 Tax=Candidatus Cerribacteria bacterium 'Amazon FNV 2010 28 9' TaxID=2081795 RepID=A0A317JQT1_9BACT|nr:MAG: hypothetical protein C5B42_01955 [Candidatus Cerribacteria bacterium 'Amazon FNV 2010 28 9']